MLTLERLKQILKYDPETGHFTWLVDKGRMAKAGSPAGTRNKGGYVQIRVDGLIYLAHRLAWFYMNGIWPERLIDHRFGVKNDNRISEIREASRKMNSENIRRANCLSKTKLLGASPTAHGTFVAHIGINGRVKHLGCFNTAEEAHEAYIHAKRELHEGNTL